MCCCRQDVQVCGVAVACTVLSHVLQWQASGLAFGPSDTHQDMQPRQGQCEYSSEGDALAVFTDPHIHSFFLFVSETLQESQVWALDSLQAVAVPTHWHSLVTEREGSETKGLWAVKVCGMFNTTKVWICSVVSAFFVFNRINSLERWLCTSHTRIQLLQWSRPSNTTNSIVSRGRIWERHSFGASCPNQGTTWSLGSPHHC